MTKKKTPKIRWDTAGQERFRTITSSYYRGAHGIFIVYSIDDNESFIRINHWNDEIGRYAKDEVNKIIIGNKSDLGSSRQVDSESSKEISNKLNITHIETSAKDGSNVEEAFNTMAKEILKKMNQIQDNNNIQQQETKVEETKTETPISEVKSSETPKWDQGKHFFFSPQKKNYFIKKKKMEASDSVDEYLLSADIIRNFEKLSPIARAMVIGGIIKKKK